jgi:hypothetical protein
MSNSDQTQDKAVAAYNAWRADSERRHKAYEDAVDAYHARLAEAVRARDLPRELAEQEALRKAQERAEETERNRRRSNPIEYFYSWLRA